jgi:hypothetical protein
MCRIWAISLPTPIAYELFHATTSHVSELRAKMSPVSYQPADNNHGLVHPQESPHVAPGKPVRTPSIGGGGIPYRHQPRKAISCCVRILSQFFNDYIWFRLANARQNCLKNGNYLASYGIENCIAFAFHDEQTSGIPDMELEAILLVSTLNKKRGRVDGKSLKRDAMLTKNVEDSNTS